jgi:hypothetical protein
LFPTAEMILDYYHCAEHVYQVATAHYSDQPEQALAWVEATMARLFARGRRRHLGVATHAAGLGTSHGGGR